MYTNSMINSINLFNSTSATYTWVGSEETLIIANRQEFDFSR